MDRAQVQSVAPVDFSGSPASLSLGPRVYNKLGQSRDALCATGLVAVYHSAHYCPPCQAFTPELARFYNEAKVLIHLPPALNQTNLC